MLHAYFPRLRHYITICQVTVFFQMVNIKRVFENPHRDSVPIMSSKCKLQSP
jgi:hypothetical protein